MIYIRSNYLKYLFFFIGTLQSAVGVRAQLSKETLGGEAQTIQSGTLMTSKTSKLKIANKKTQVSNSDQVGQGDFGQPPTSGGITPTPPKPQKKLPAAKSFGARHNRIGNDRDQVGEGDANQPGTVGGTKNWK